MYFVLCYIRFLSVHTYIKSGNFCVTAAASLRSEVQCKTAIFAKINRSLAVYLVSNYLNCVFEVFRTTVPMHLPIEEVGYDVTPHSNN